MERPETTTERVSIRERLRHFTWTHFGSTMSTGAIAVLLGQQPFDFNGCWTIGKVFFLTDLVLFVACSCLITLRFCLSEKPICALKKSLYGPHESFFFGAVLVSINLLIHCMELYTAEYNWAWTDKALEVLFWLYVAASLVLVVLQYHIIFGRLQLPVGGTMPAWVLPAYPFLVCGPLAATLQNQLTAERGVPVIVGGLACQGLGFCLALLMYSLYFERLVAGSLPPAGARPGMYVAVGPAAYTSNALVALGYQARRQLPPDFLLGPTAVPVGDLWYALGVAAGLFVWLLSFWFFALATVSFLSGVRQFRFSVNCWAFVFPNAGLTVATIWIGRVLDSTAVNAVAAAMTVLCVVAWLLVAVAYVRGIWKGDIMWPGRDEDEQDIMGRDQDSLEDGKEHSA